MNYQLKGKYFDCVVHPRKAHTIIVSTWIATNTPLIEIEQQIAKNRVRGLVLLAILVLLAFIALWIWLFLDLTKLNKF